MGEKKQIALSESHKKEIADIGRMIEKNNSTAGTPPVEKSGSAVTKLSKEGGAMKAVRVLIIDDSALVRDILTRGLSTDPGIEVVGSAPDVYIARDKIVFLKPDVLTLDVEMPRMDGVEFLKRLMPQFPLPVVMVSSLTKEGSRITMDALEAGALDFVLKPSVNLGSGLGEMLSELIQKIKAASKVDVSRYREQGFSLKTVRKDYILEGSTDRVIAIGASTGGTVALNTMIQEFPPNMPGTVIVQHMPPTFTRLFAERLNDISRVQVKEAQDGDRIVTGRVLVAPGDNHMEVVRSGGIYMVKLSQAEKVNGHRPSVEVLFESVARHVGPNAVGVMLTGMGADGARAMLSMRQAGARTLAQDEATSVVFGMPGEAWKCGGAERLVPINDMTGAVLELLKDKKD